MNTLKKKFKRYIPGTKKAKGKRQGLPRFKSGRGHKPVRGRPLSARKPTMVKLTSGSKVKPLRLGISGKNVKKSFRRGLTKVVNLRGK